MKTLTYIFLYIVCIVSLACCNPYHEDVVDIRKMSTVDALFLFESNCDTVYFCSNIGTSDSLGSYIAYNFQYPYDLIGDSIDLFCEMELDVDSNGYVSKFVDVTINDGEELTKQARKNIFPVLKKESERVIRKYKFEGPSVSCYPCNSRFVADSTRLRLGFHIVPYPVGRVDSKELVLYYLSQLNCFSGYHVGDIDGKPVDWVLQQKLIAMTTAEEKIDYALNCDVPTIKLTAFKGLVNTNYPKCASIICKTIEKGDTSAVKRHFDCEAWTEYTVDAMLSEFRRYDKSHSKADSLMLDSLLFYSPKVKDIWEKYKLMEELKPTPERYQRARDLYTKEHYTHALTLLAKYKKEQDKQLIIDALSIYSKEKTKSPEEMVEEVKAEISPYSKPIPPRYCKSEFQEALKAIEIWPDKTFVLVLKNVIADISKKGVDKHDNERQRDLDRLKELYNKITK